VERQNGGNDRQKLVVIIELQNRTEQTIKSELRTGK
jgi:hypothetical protein